jgi:hypothetical protein
MTFSGKESILLALLSDDSSCEEVITGNSAWNALVAFSISDFVPEASLL